MNISDISAASGYGQMRGLQAGGGLKGLADSFGAIFDKADDAAKAFAAKKLDTQSVVEAFSQAELALQTAVTVRDRVVSAYQEILRMPM
ncbi:flagellar hook-basal body complex protein FliE [Parvularcula maris]|uniref:Flagellar hook-basal body complex protein FliE n=1 Tax=Parvularcula maris TaxID=2965077 RepID=A0A9X2L887_9PROT|nr:flagellar hook-basal body complex protein FliE [Parvularcula maris]MCQ8184910.1 flagellar hook-basal body complex protein FliE [Parvularcula maris]